MTEGPSDLGAPEKIRTPNLLIRRQPWPVRRGLSPSMSAAARPTISALTCGVRPNRSVAVRGRPRGLDGEFSMSCDIVVTTTLRRRPRSTWAERSDLSEEDDLAGRGLNIG